MITQYKDKANLGAGLAILGGVTLGVYTALNIHKLELLSNDPVLTVGVYIISGLLVWACYNYAKGKGYSGWFALLGFLNLLGLIILVCLPDKNKTAASKTKTLTSSSMNSFQAGAYYLLLIASGLFILLSAAGCFEAFSHLTKDTKTIKLISDSVNIIIVFLITLTVFIGGIKKTNWLFSLFLPYFICIQAYTVYRFIVLHDVNGAIMGTLLNLLFFLPIYINKKIFYDGRLLQGAFYIGSIVGILDFVTSMLGR